MCVVLMNNQLSIKKIDRAEFEKLEKSLKTLVIPLEQSPTWGEFDNAIDGREFLGSYGFYDCKERLVALGSATLYRQKGRDWVWFKHGPVFTSVPNTETVQKMCAALKSYFGGYKNGSILFIRLNSPTASSDLILPFEHTMYDQTVIVNLVQSEDEILKGMSQSGRRSLRDAQKTGIKVEEITQHRSDYFTKNCFPILQETGLRDGFGIHPLSSYTAMLDTLKDVARLYVAQDGAEVLAWAITTEYNSQAVYYYGGSSAKARVSSAAYLLQWEMMIATKSRGNKTYDFMGIAGKNFEGLKNVTQFKIKFSKNIVDIPFTYDLPLKKMSYRILTSAIALKRRLR